MSSILAFKLEETKGQDDFQNEGKKLNPVHDVEVISMKGIENGGVEKAANLGHPHFMPNASFLLGWDGSRRNDLPWTIHIGPEVYLQYPYNHIFLPHVAAKIGFTYKFKQR